MFTLERLRANTGTCLYILWLRHRSIEGSLASNAWAGPLKRPAGFLSLAYPIICQHKGQVQGPYCAPKITTARLAASALLVSQSYEKARYALWGLGTLPAAFSRVARAIKREIPCSSAKKLSFSPLLSSSFFFFSSSSSRSSISTRPSLFGPSLTFVRVLYNFQTTYQCQPIFLLILPNKNTTLQSPCVSPSFSPASSPSWLLPSPLPLPLPPLPPSL
jgi:hypothetical protein